MSKRTFLAPEVIQTSAMDCGPAALKCLLAGFGIPVAYGRLREACQTSVDGTSIDTLEVLAQTLGLDAEQVMLPVDHLLLPEANALPAIVVVRLPSGLTHFVVVWRAHGGFVQVMDPARGRRWVRRASFLRDVYRHRQIVPADAFAEWASSDGFTTPLGRRLRALGVADPDAAVAAAKGAGDWRAIAALDGAARTVTALCESGAVSRGREADGLVAALSSAPADATGGLYAFATAAPAAEDGTPQVAVQGAVLLHVGDAGVLDEAARRALPLELQAAVDEHPPRVAGQLWSVARAAGAGRLIALVGGLIVAGLGAVAEGLLFRRVVDAFAGGVPSRAGAGPGVTTLLALLVLIAALAGVEWPLARGLRRTGARIEEALRALYLRKIPRLPDRYFQTRPVSDMAERAHLLHRLRALPALVGDAARVALEIVVIGAGLCVLDRAGWALALVASSLAIPLLAQPALAERDLRMRNHAGALGRFYLDGLLGLVAARIHRGEAALAREHRDRLLEWGRAARGALAAALAAETTQSVVGFGLGAALLLRVFARGAGGASGPADPGTILLIVYWSLSLPALGQELSTAVQQLPAQRNLTLRLLEPLGAPEDAAAGDASAALDGAAGVRIQLSGVRVVAGGHEILQVDDLAFAPGEHVAIVGPSGAGKSSLVGLLLGWHRAAAGDVRVDGAPLAGGTIQALRDRTAWVDPSVYLWNRSLADNLTFGRADAPAAGDRELEALLDAAELRGVAARLPGGTATALGEAGGLVSGGEGQRVRFGRALARKSPRLVVLDEPFRGLPRDRRGSLMQRARDRWRDATLLCVTHDIAETAAFARVLVVEGGRVVEDGPPHALRARPDSRYTALAEAEQRVRDAVWADPAWRRWRVENGRVTDGSA
ncbi:MAG TPA: cysteine peptidase family C39 domain-containing protein [Polyangia bacterium]|nr:cysteine peptidase family C39 domain-containing protein [Polyangia bacterium]